VKNITLAVGGFVEIKPVDKFYGTKKASRNLLKPCICLLISEEILSPDTPLIVGSIYLVAVARIRTNPLCGFHMGRCPLLAGLATLSPPKKRIP